VTHIKNLESEHADIDADRGHADVMRNRVHQRGYSACLSKKIAGARPRKQVQSALEAHDQKIVAGLGAQLLNKEVDAAAAQQGLRGRFVASDRVAENNTKLKHVVHAKNVTVVACKNNENTHTAAGRLGNERHK